MRKLLLICSATVMLYEDCVWGMEDDLYANPWEKESASKSRRSSGSRENSNMARRNSGIISAGIQKLKNFNPLRRSKSDSQLNNENLRQKNYAGSRVVAAQAEQSWNGQTQANPQQLQENRFIKIETEYSRINGASAGPTGAVLNNTYLQYHYDLSNNSKIGYATPTTVITKDDLKNWNDISEIRYANDVSYDKLENPKVILYRNKDNSCYIILRTDDGKKYGVFYGLDERNVEIGRNSFAVYDVSEDVGSFTDGVERLIYVDESGLYFVSANENPVEDVINTYQSEGKFDFKGSVIKVSAIDGTITWNGNAITEDNFFDNWVKEERETEKQISQSNGRTVIEKVKETKTVLSNVRPKSREVLRNFYPPNGSYKKILGANYQYTTDTNPGGHQVHTALDWLNAYGIPNKVGTSWMGPRAIIDLKDRNWFSAFITVRLQLAKARDENEAKKLIKNGIFALVLSTYTDRRYDHGSYLDNNEGYPQKIREAITSQVAAKGGQTTRSVRDSFRNKNVDVPSSISDLVSQNSALFKDPDFVRSLKPGFAGLEKDYEHNKQSELWLPFEIVRNL